MLLKTHASCSTASLAKTLGTTTEAVRQQIAKLVEQGLVEGAISRAGVGRPKQLWQLTAAGHARFPNTHAQLTVQIIESVGGVFGEDGVARMIEHRGARQLTQYRERLASARSLGERVTRLAQIRAEEGYMARVERDGPDFLLIEDHCPICAAATACQRFCASELEQFQTLMGDLAEVSREEHLLSKGRRCVYRLRKASSPKG
ncbi:helix-turn-helix transcriptional regulator [Burkholderia ubonensis]|uniref:helix-turn-helix transcriptional regulator n=1 Tax=Burkholderia ubonensis TaxID=101571 RepID=UPI0018DF52DC|nr:metalloregulator ArsR/SmtB family transcription factor [Burkholderia ubonensis]